MNDYKTVHEDIIGICDIKIGEIKDILHDCYILSEYLHGCIDAGVVPPEAMNPLIERLNSEINNLMRICTALEELIRLEKEFLMNSDSAKQILVKAENIVAALHDSFRDADYFEMLIENIGNIVAYWYRQKWLDGKSTYSFSFFSQKYHGFIVTLNAELMPILFKRIEQINKYTEFVSMSCVYAPPEVMFRSDKLNKNETTYPLMHTEIL